MAHPQGAAPDLSIPPGSPKPPGSPTLGEPGFAPRGLAQHGGAAHAEHHGLGMAEHGRDLVTACGDSGGTPKSPRGHAGTPRHVEGHGGTPGGRDTKRCRDTGEHVEGSRDTGKGSGRRRTTPGHTEGHEGTQGGTLEGPRCPPGHLTSMKYELGLCTSRFFLCLRFSSSGDGCNRSLASCGDTAGTRRSVSPGDPAIAPVPSPLRPLTPLPPSWGAPLRAPRRQRPARPRPRRPPRAFPAPSRPSLAPPGAVPQCPGRRRGPGRVGPHSQAWRQRREGPERDGLSPAPPFPLRGGPRGGSGAVPSLGCGWGLCAILGRSRT